MVSDRVALGLALALASTCVAGTHVIQDFEGRPGLGPNSRTYKPDGRASTRYVSDAPVGRWAAEIHVPPCGYGFWQLTGQNGPAIAAASPTAFVIWHRSVDQPVPLRLILRERDGERWTTTLTCRPGPWQQEVLPLSRWSSIGGGKADRTLDLPQVAVFQFQFSKSDQPRVFQVDGLCVTSDPARAKEAMVGIPVDRLKLQERFGRLTANLAGVWGFQPAEEGLTFPPKGSEWRRLHIAATQVWKHNHWGKYDLDWAKVTRAWYQRRFVLPTDVGGRRILIHFDAVHAEADVWCNGRKVGRHVGGLTPFDVDITTAVKLGEPNELVVGCAGPLAKGIEPQPRGAMYRFHAGIWQAAQLVAPSPAHVAKVFAVPSVRNKTLVVHTTLCNRGTTETLVALSNVVLDGDTEAKRFPSQRVVLKPGGTRTVTQELPWPAPKLWWPHSPHLYTLHTILQSPSGPLDGLATRFGFREFWIDGSAFRLNRVKVRLKATWGHSGEWYYGRPGNIRDTLRVLKAHHVNAVRYHGQPLPPEFLDAADEVGMMVIAESGLYHSPVHENSLVHTREWVLRDRNHPSIVIWSGSNEFGHWIVPRDKVKTEFLLKQEALIRSLDPTRPIMQHGYGPLDGKEEIYNIHYPERALAMMPNTFYWPVKHKIEINPHYPDFAWKQEKPLAIGEHLLGCDGRSSLFVGDSDYGKDRDWRAAAQVFAVAMNAYRLCGVAHVAPQVFQSSPGGKSVPNPYLEGIADAFKPEGVFFTNRCWHFWAGDTIEKSLVVYNETLQPQRYVVPWALKLGKQAVSNGRCEVDLPPGEVRRLKITVKLPQVNACAAGVLEAKLTRRDNGEAVVTGSMLIKVFPRTEPAKLQKRVGLYDPKSATAQCLAALGVEPLPIAEPTAAELARVQTLVVGSEALSPAIEEHAQHIEAFVRGGGHVVCLEQAVMPRWLPVPLQLVSDKGSPAETCAFHRGHPIIRPTGGPHGWDLCFWNDDHVVTPRSMYKPILGNFTPIADSGLKLERCPLIEVHAGKGSYVICQLALVGKFAREPMAQVLLKRMLEYCEWRKPRQWPKAAILGSRGSRFFDAVTLDLKAQVEPIEPAGAIGDSIGLVLVDGASLAKCDLAGLRQVASRGGTVLVHGVERDHAAALAGLLDTPVAIKPAEAKPVRLKRDRLSERDYPNALPPTWGMANYDLAWDSKSGAGLPADRIKHRVQLAGALAKQWTDMEGALVELPLGKGRVVIDQFLWDRETYDTARAQRYASLLLTNLGVQIKALSLVPVSEKGYFFVDIRRFANGSLVSPHGNDLRNLPTGKQEFRGVPFWVIPPDQNKGLSTMGLNNALVLPDGTRIDSNRAKPMHVEGIPVRKRVGRLAFLHLAGFSHSKKRYAKSKIAEYVVNYRGGATERVPVRAQIEVTNWWNDWRQDLPNAKVAWKGSNPRTDKIAVYLLEWSNPFPEREVESIDFRSAGNPAWGMSCVAISGLEVE